jgi:hypothetical protein
MTMLRTVVLSTALISSGLVATTGMAFASGHTDGSTVQKGLINSSDFAPNTTGEACNNDVPANVAGLQVPVQDNAASVPLVSKAGHGNAAGISKSCSNPIHAVN